LKKDEREEGRKIRKGRETRHTVGRRVKLHSLKREEDRKERERGKFRRL